jgi:hypothetical protein
MSYRDFLLKHVGVGEEAVTFFAGNGYRNNMRVDTCPAWVAMRSHHAPGFAGMEIAEAIEAESDNFHFPDGNASIARLLVGKLVPTPFPPPATWTAWCPPHAITVASTCPRTPPVFACRALSCGSNTSRAIRRGAWSR